MIKLDLSRRQTKSPFVEYDIEITVDDKSYDLTMSFLIFAKIQPNQAVEFVLKPDLQMKSFEGSRSPVKKVYQPQYGWSEYVWLDGIREVRDCLNSFELPLDPVNNDELFDLCFHHPIKFKAEFNKRLRELQKDSNTQDVGLYAAPQWEQIRKQSLRKIPSEANKFFESILYERLEDKGYETNS